MSDVESVTSVLKQVFTDYSAPPTVVVNAAGITRDNFMLKMSVQDFESVFNVNVKVIKQCGLKKLRLRCCMLSTNTILL